jgi:putative copper export protein
MKILASLLAAMLIVPAPAWAAVKPGEVEILAATEDATMQKQNGSLSFPNSRQIVFQSDSGKTLTIPCSEVTHTSFTTKSKMLKRVAVPAISAAIFTMGLSLFALAIRGHGYYLVVDYGKGQQVVFSLGKDVYAQDVNATSACTGKPTEILK